MKISALIFSAFVLLFAASCTSQNVKGVKQTESLVNTCWKVLDQPCQGCFTLQQSKNMDKIRKSDPYTYLCFSENKVRIKNNCTGNYADYSFNQETGFLNIENMADGAVSTDCNRPDIPPGNYRVSFENQKMKIRLENPENNN